VSTLDAAALMSTDADLVVLRKMTGEGRTLVSESYPPA
jgi:hypothetical protein